MSEHDKRTTATGPDLEAIPPALPALWVFGYGSLLWNPNFPYEDTVVGYVKGYARRFWQGSVVHQGTPEAPGRVVTLVESKEECTWGIAYKVEPSNIPDVMTYLNRRETSSYKTHQITFHPTENRLQEPFTVLTYIGLETHPNYLGPAPMDSIARQIVSSRGKGVSNAQYVLQLAKAARTITSHTNDEHLFDLEARVKTLLLHEGEPTERECTCEQQL